MIYRLNIVFPFIFFFICKSYSQTPHDILIETNNKMASLSNYIISFSGVVYMTPMNPDTLYSNANVYTIKKENDSILGYSYYLESSRTDCGKTVSYYNGDEYARTNDFTKYYKAGDQRLKRSLYGTAFINMYFEIQYVYLKNLLKKHDALKLELLNDTIINDKSSFHIRGILNKRLMVHNQFNYPPEKIDNGLFINEEMKVIVDLFICKKDYLPQMFVYNRLRKDLCHMYAMKKINTIKVNLETEFVIPDGVHFKESLKSMAQFNCANSSNMKYKPFCLHNSDSLLSCLDTIKSEKILLVFSVTGCMACVKSLESINCFYNQQKNEEICLVYITLFPNLTQLKTYKQKHKLDFEIYLGNRDIWREYRIQGFPTYFLVDENRTIVKTHLGYMSKEQIDFFAKINK